MKDTGNNRKERSIFSLASLQTKFAKLLGAESSRKETLYIELSRGSTLLDLVYWLQIVFSAGIATLGLVMNSPAVIIGAMLISPLMGPILASGLALASGDLILGIRSITKLFLSCFSAVLFSVLLVIILPFRELTGEIAARTEPNILDLLIALFSGAIGSIAVCRDVKGIATSIPGVAIAVALMPPLCVAGYGLGLMITFDTSSGWRIASGGGLLFLTNLVAITFMAMVVFLVIRLSSLIVRRRAEDWEHSDPESAFILHFIERFPRLAQAREIRSLTLRFALILLPLVAIFIPLGKSFSRLRTEIADQRQENQIKREVVAVWQDRFHDKNGSERGTLDQLKVVNKGGKVEIDMRVFDEDPLDAAEKNDFVKLIAARLGRSQDSISLKLTEVPTTSVLASLRKLVVEPRETSISELRANLARQVDDALQNLELPPEAKFVGRDLIVDGAGDMRLNITYLCERNLEQDVRRSVLGTIRDRLKDPTTDITLERIPIEVGPIEFPRQSDSIPILGILQLDFVGRVMRENPNLKLVVVGDDKGLQNARIGSIQNHLESKWQIDSNRLVRSEESTTDGTIRLSFQSSSRSASTRNTSDSD
ncbi:MAG: hypothetical protein DMF63_02560 [Acidobacteria bacterium]|nr:MAG: hypothetical protein DMF63_02560 [Acidobacteriota bacterium]